MEATYSETTTLIPLKENKMRINDRKAGTIGAIAAMVLVGTALCANLAIGQPAAKSSDDQQVPNRDRYLLLDARIIESTENAELTLGVVRKDENNPLLKEDKPWEPRFDNPYCSVIYDEEDKIYKCWYSIFIRSGPRGDFPGEGLAAEKRAWVPWREGARGFGVCYATS